MSLPFSLLWIWIYFLRGKKWQKKSFLVPFHVRTTINKIRLFWKLLVSFRRLNSFNIECSWNKRKWFFRLKSEKVIGKRVFCCLQMKRRFWKGTNNLGKLKGAKRQFGGIPIAYRVKWWLFESNAGETINMEWYRIEKFKNGVEEAKKSQPTVFGGKLKSTNCFWLEMTPEKLKWVKKSKNGQKDRWMSKQRWKTIEKILKKFKSQKNEKIGEKTENSTK